MPQPAMRDPGGGLWVVGSEGRLGAGQSVCVRARALQVAYVRGPPAPLRWGSKQRLLLVWSFSPAFPFALVKVQQGICLLSEP